MIYSPIFTSPQIILALISVKIDENLKNTNMMLKTDINRNLVTQSDMVKS